MVGPLRRLISRLIWSLPDWVLLRLLSMRHTLSGTDVEGVLVNDGGVYMVMERGTGRTIAVPHRLRLAVFNPGIGARLRSLAESYCLETSMIKPGDLVIDCGANCGELGLWVRALGARYMAFEPDPAAFAALKHNVGAGHASSRALSDETGTAVLAMATATADSSLVGVNKRGGLNIPVHTIRLDDVVRDQGVESIRVLKVEAEGFEPEVLNGAIEALGLTDIVTVDAGPERQGHNTVPEVTRILVSRGFLLRAANLRSGRFLFVSARVIDCDPRPSSCFERRDH